MSPLRLIVGLGNPGEQHRDTRHNAGFWLVDMLAQRAGGVYKRENKFSAEVARIDLGGRPLWLLKPQTYMNRSGAAVGVFARFFRLRAAEILVAHDELDLPPGVARLKLGGGHGGHNGLRDVSAQLGDAYLRLRLGIGHPGNAAAVVAYVLRRPPPAERSLLGEAIADSLEVLPQVIDGDLAAAMNTLHGRRPNTLV